MRILLLMKPCPPPLPGLVFYPWGLKGVEKYINICTLQKSFLHLEIRGQTIFLIIIGIGPFSKNVKYKVHGLEVQDPRAGLS